MSDDIQELLKELQRNYLASIPEKIRAIESLWHARESALLKTDFHKLKGTGRTYGLPEVTQIGEAMEQIVANGDSITIDACVPIAIELLLEVARERGEGRTPHIEEGSKFQHLVQVLTQQHTSIEDIQAHKNKKTG